MWLENTPFSYFAQGNGHSGLPKLTPLALKAFPGWLDMEGCFPILEWPQASITLAKSIIASANVSHTLFPQHRHTPKNESKTLLRSLCGLATFYPIASPKTGYPIGYRRLFHTMLFNSRSSQVPIGGLFHRMVIHRRVSDRRLFHRRLFYRRFEINGKHCLGCLSYAKADSVAA